MSSAIALESLSQRGRSAFYNDLVSLYQTTIQAIEPIPSPVLEDVCTQLKKLSFTTHLQDIVKKYTNISLSAVVIIKRNVPNMMAIMRRPDYNIMRQKPTATTSGIILERINALYDEKTGRLINDVKSDTPIDFFLTINAGWWTIRGTDGKLYFTAEELAANTLHEVGHIDHNIRTHARVISRNLNASGVIDYVVQNPDPEVVRKLIAAIKTSKYLSKEWTETLKVLEQHFNQPSPSYDSAHLEALSTLAAIVAAEAASQNLDLYRRELVLGSEQVKTSMDVVDMERSADEYASRNGAYAALASSVSKLNNLDSVDAHLIYRKIETSKVSVIMSSLQSFKQLFAVSAEDISNGYDPLIRRMSLIVETAKHAFQDDQLPSEVKEDLFRQITEAEQYIKRYQSSIHHRMRIAIKAWRDNIGKLGRLIAAPFQNRLVQDYGRLQNETRSLGRHPLYYLANKK